MNLASETGDLTLLLRQYPLLHLIHALGRAIVGLAEGFEGSDRERVEWRLRFALWVMKDEE